MTTLREAAQAVLDRWDSPAWEWLKQGPTAALMADLRAALAEPVQEPVAWRFQSAVGGWAYGSEPPLGSKYPAYPLYTAPPQRKPLTEEEIDGLFVRSGLGAYHQKDFAVQTEYDRCIERFARIIEKAHGIGEQP